MKEKNKKPQNTPNTLIFTTKHTKHTKMPHRRRPVCKRYLYSL